VLCQSLRPIPMADPDLARAMWPCTSLSMELDPEVCDEARRAPSGHRASRLLAGDEVRVFSTSLETWFPGIVSEPMLDGCWASFEANGLAHRKFLRYDSAHLDVGAASSRKLPLSCADCGGVQGDSAGVSLSSETAERLERLRWALRLIEGAAGVGDRCSDTSLSEVDPGWGPQAPSWMPRPGSDFEIPPVRDQGDSPYCALLSLAAIVENYVWKTYRVRLDWVACGTSSARLPTRTDAIVAGARAMTHPPLRPSSGTTGLSYEGPIATANR